MSIKTTIAVQKFKKNVKIKKNVFLVVKGTAADATDAPQP
jgi:hypothetical protein